MKKIHSLFIIGFVLLLYSSCNNDDTIIDKLPEEKGFSPIISATYNVQDTTKAGVIENDIDYTQGEKFRWDESDKATIFFNQERLNYSISALSNESNQANFITLDHLSGAGVYDIYGFYPADGWNFTTRSVSLPAIQKQAYDESTHLGEHMYMRAIKKRVSVTADPNNPIELNYEQLTSVLRIAIKNTSSIDGANLKVKSITLSSTGSYKFHTKAHLESRDAEGFTIDPAGDKSNITLTCYNGEFTSSSSDYIFSGYMTLLPGGAFPTSEKAVVTITYTDNAGKHYLQEKEIDVSSFWGTNGIEAGKSYYMRILTGELTEQAYAVRDYYPSPANPKNAMGLVFSTSESGKHGKILGLDYIIGLKWSTTAGQDNATNTDNGLANIIAIRRKISNNDWPFYPGFEWVHKKNHAETSYASTNAKGIWYMPSIGELEDLYCVYHGKPVERWGYPGSGNDENDRPSFSVSMNSSANIIFNNKLIAAGGSEIGYISYNSSTEFSIDTRTCYFLSILDGQVLSAYKNTNGYVFRAIMAY